ncbi:MAG: pyrroline-5-carboxylate reductase [Alphaproteobacteria bacterium]|nr:pyrroline-5-carboxylate reductase [Alphaproteobacteria bacterium]
MADAKATPKLDLLLVGGGRMGSALLHGWLDQGIEAAGISVVEPEPPTGIADLVHDGVTVVASPEELAADLTPAVTVFAVKPQIIGSILEHYAQYVAAKTVYLSIAAGITLARLGQGLGRRAAIVRAMPNTPAAVGSGITVLAANKKVGRAGRDLSQNLMAAVGETAWVEDEALMDAVTAVSGSGPAYVFLLVEAMTQAGIEAGLPDDLAGQLARATVIGSGDLLRQARESAAELRQNVTSPAGTTAAALEILMAGDGLGALMTRAIARAAERSRELAAS